MALLRPSSLVIRGRFGIVQCRWLTTRSADSTAMISASRGVCGLFIIAVETSLILETS